MKARIALLLLLAASAAAQAEIYQWQDENGRQHFGEEVPARYQKKAKPVQTGPLNIMPPQRLVAPRAPSPQTTGPLGALPQAETAPAVASTDDERCRAALQRYQESQACFARFRLSNGAVRPEAYEQCRDVASPEGCETKR